MAGSTVPSTSDSRKKGSLSRRSFWPPRESALGHRCETAQRQRAHPRGARSPPSRLAGGATTAVTSRSRVFERGTLASFDPPTCTCGRWIESDGSRRFGPKTGLGGLVKCRPMSSPPSAISRRVGPDQNRSMCHFQLKCF
jgi:hypothetical protein